MNNLALEKLINEANLLLVRAEEELQKPQTEMVSFAACQTAKLSIFKLLKAYLIKHKVDVNGSDNLVHLYDKCKKYNAAFIEVNIPKMDCVSGSHCDMEEYCMESNYVIDCVDKAKSIRTLLYQT
jgi:HEPN domain-containing protein